MSDEKRRTRPVPVTTRLRRVVRQRPTVKTPVMPQDTAEAAPRQDDPSVLAQELDPALVERFGPLARLADAKTDRLYVALDPRTSRLVALRVAKAASAGARRIEHEARLLARVTHMNLVALVGHGTAGRQVWIACQYLEGATLRRRLDSGPRPPREAALIVSQVLDGLSALHRAGWVHRDLSPERVRESGTGLYKVLGFTRALPPPGTAPLDARSPADLRYAAPEVVLGERPGPAADVYAAGAVLYELLAGVPPFIAANDGHLIARITAEDPAPPSRHAPLPAGFDELVLRALAKDPAARFPGALAMSDALRALVR